MGERTENEGLKASHTPLLGGDIPGVSQVNAAATFPAGYGLGDTAMKIAALKRFAAGLTLLALMGSATAFAQQSNKPNILVIHADNLDYGDLGVYGRRGLRRAPAPPLH